MTQPTVTHAIQMLEQELDCVLFQRSRKGVSLTPEAAMLYEHVRAACEHIFEAESALKAKKKLLEGQVRIGASETTLHFFLLPFLKEFKTLHPGVKIKAVSYTHLPYPLLPLQLSLIGSLTIGIPSFFLALEPNSSRVEGHFMSNVFYKALPGGLTNLFLVLGIELFTYAFDFPVEQLYSISAVTVLFVGLLVLYQVCRPFDWKRRTVWSVMTVAALVCVVFFGELFSIRPLTMQTCLLYTSRCV